MAVRHISITASWQYVLFSLHLHGSTSYFQYSFMAVRLISSTASSQYSLFPLQLHGTAALMLYAQHLAWLSQMLSLSYIAYVLHGWRCCLFTRLFTCLSSCLTACSVLRVPLIALLLLHMLGFCSGPGPVYLILRLRKKKDHLPVINGNITLRRSGAHPFHFL